MWISYLDSCLRVFLSSEMRGCKIILWRRQALYKRKDVKTVSLLDQLTVMNMMHLIRSCPQCAPPLVPVFLIFVSCHWRRFPHYTLWFWITLETSNAVGLLGRRVCILFDHRPMLSFEIILLYKYTKRAVGTSTHRDGQEQETDLSWDKGCQGVIIGSMPKILKLMLDVNICCKTPLAT